MLCQFFSVFKASKSSVFKVQEPLDNACSNIIFFGFNMGRLSLRDFHCSGHDRLYALLSYKDFEKRSISWVNEVIKANSEGRGIQSRTISRAGVNGASSAHQWRRLHPGRLAVILLTPVDLMPD